MLSHARPIPAVSSSYPEARFANVGSCQTVRVNPDSRPLTIFAGLLGHLAACTLLRHHAAGLHMLEWLPGCLPILA